MTRWLRYLAYAALAAVLAVAVASYLIYRSLLPPELPTRPTMVSPPLVRGAVLTLLGPDANATVARLHLDQLERGGRLPPASGSGLLKSYQKERLRVSALSKWLSIHFSPDEVAESYAMLVPVDGDRRGLGAGAQALFGKPLQQLAPHEVALLLAYAWSPREMDPACRPEDARRARDVFLTRMAGDHLISADAVAAQQAMPIQGVRPCPDGTSNGNPARDAR